MRYIILFLLNISFVGCSSSSIENAMDNSMVAISGNKPPKFFRVANLQTMQDYIFDMEDYTIAMPSAKQEDFSKLNGWQGLTHYDKEITLYLGAEKFGYPYHITVTPSKVKEYGKKEKAIDNTTIEYPKKRILKDGEIINIDVHTEFYGKENYACTVAQSMNQKFKKYKIGYRCYKSNLTKTKVKNVLLLLTYNQPNDLLLRDEYTYEDLQQRAKRVLDSLYIKDGWDE
ncbi:MAG: hypothetical protein FP820_11075 [Sulfurimonas sp.]|nr:hypothetical protein [Sulfurimonas sp.]MBU3938299.1 hypothetical protein [bacterium]MBU4025224.1 hypothetical protein [bacterium]MBU4110103.1 hypothetical protein [bacterium]